MHVTPSALRNEGHAFPFMSFLCFALAECVAECLFLFAQVQADALSASFEAPLKEFVRLVRSAKAVMADRGAALSALQHAKADMEMRRGKLLKMRGVPGIKARRSRRAEAALAHQNVSARLTLLLASLTLHD